MGKKIVYIVLGALLIFGLLFLLWSWFFTGSTATQSTNGSFGFASDTSQTSGTNIGTSGNGINTLGQGTESQNVSNGLIPLGGTGGTNGTNGNSNGTNGGGTGSGASTATGALGAGGTGATLDVGTGATLANGVLGSGGTSGGSTDVSTLGTVGTVPITTGSNVSPSGVIWLGGADFTPDNINNISSDGGGSAPTITSTPAGSSGTSLIEALAATAIAGSLTCALQAGVVAVSTTGTAASVGGAAATAAASATGAPVSDLATHALLGLIAGQQTTQNARNASKDSVTFSQCLINVIAKTALQQITISVVNWINSGFNGQPSFVTNYQQFFTNVADLSAGQFIQGSGLAFLCSPFQAQIKIAIAQSYANKGAQSCSLTGIINNITNFMNGGFSQGGWPGLLSFTTVPTNNPYGAFAYAQVGLVSAQNQAASNANKNILPGGFIGLQQQTCNGQTTVAPLIGQNGQAALTSNVVPAGCKVTLTTPGTVIQNALFNTENSGPNQLGLASDIDQIISALTTQLVTKTLQNGLASLSQGTTQTAADLAAQQQAATLLVQMQNNVSIVQQVAAVDQGSISDIQNVQSDLNNLANCWGNVASTSSSNAAEGTQNVANANATLQSLETQVNAYNNDITQQNTTIATIDQLEAQVSSAQSDADVANATASYNAVASTFPAQSDVTTDQQNRTTLQSQLATIEASTQTGLQQCQAAAGTN